MKNIIIALLLLTLTACQGNSRTTKDNTTNEAVTVIENEVTEVAEPADDEVVAEAEDIPVGGLNAIRFDGWTDNDWLDNDYIREIRKFCDAYSRGEINDGKFDSLKPYKTLMKSKFIVIDIQPYIFGGVSAAIVFLDNTKPIFDTWVYSDIDEKKKVVTGYEIRLCELSDNEFNITKERILEIIEEHPENKLW